MESNTAPDAPDTGELQKILDDLIACAEWRYQRKSARTDEGMFAANESLNVRRRSVLDLFERLQDRIAELERSTSSGVNQEGARFTR